MMTHGVLMSNQGCRIDQMPMDNRFSIFSILTSCVVHLPFLMTEALLGTVTVLPVIPRQDHTSILLAENSMLHHGCKLLVFCCDSLICNHIGNGALCPLQFLARRHEHVKSGIKSWCPCHQDGADLPSKPAGHEQGWGSCVHC